MNSRERDVYGDSFNLFRSGESVPRVAEKLRIPVSKAMELKKYYLWVHADATQFLVKGYQRERGEIIEGLLNELKLSAAGSFKSLDDPEIRRRIDLILEVAPDSEQILLFPANGGRAAEWTRD